MDPSISVASRLPRSLSSSETWGFGLTGLLLWLGIAPAMQLELGWQALWVWAPGALIGILINLQVQRLSERWSDLSGGTPSYLSRLLPESTWLATYGALGYYISWVAVLPVNAIVLTDLLQANLVPFGIVCPTAVLQVGFTAIAFIVALSGTRALGILHLFFVVPAVSLLLLYCLQGIGWIALSQETAPVLWNEFHIDGWAKWYIPASYAVYACETGSAFVADSRYPQQTLKVLPVAAALIPIVYLAGSWVLLQLGTQHAVGLTPYQQLLSAAPFWGQQAAFVVTFLLASGSLLSCATAVSNTPRMLYQLSLDGQLPPIFAKTSRRGVLAVGLLLTLLLSVAFLLWGDIAQIIFVTGIGWLTSFAIFHAGLWQQRSQSYARWPWFSLGFAVIETFAILVGGLAWGWQDLILGALLPGGVWLFAQAAGRLPWQLMSGLPERRPSSGRLSQPRQDWAFVQIAGLMALLSGAIIASWLIHGRIEFLPTTNQANVLVVVVLIGVAVGVAIAGWTTLPQITAIGEAREQAEQFFNMAADGILVLDAEGDILQANHASRQLFECWDCPLVGQRLHQLLPDLLQTGWPSAAPDTVPRKAEFSGRALEVSLSASTLSGNSRAPSDRSDQYVAIVRDITERQSAEDALRQKAAELQQLLTQLTQAQSQLIQAEKMSGLGQLVAGVAHEINNPLAFIAGNVKFAQDYALDLLELVAAYQSIYPEPPASLAQKIERLDFDFLETDFPKLLRSMKEGANRILDIVQSLKTFSRHDESPTKAVNLQDGIESTLVILRNRLKANGLRPEIQIQRNFAALPPVECFPSALNQVFMNLLVNAVDALETLDLEASQIVPTIALTTRPASRDGRAGVEIVVADNGPGIPADKRDRLCDPFFTTKPTGKGTGLGLSISYQIVVDRHGGLFLIEDAPGGGAQFTIWIPLSLSSEPNAIAAPSQAA